MLQILCFIFFIFKKKFFNHHLLIIASDNKESDFCMKKLVSFFWKNF